MIIKLKPSEIIERCLWYKYEYFILANKNKDEIETLVKENKEFEIKENEGLIIGLLKCIETDNLIHRLNDHIIHTMKVKNVTIPIDKNDKTAICIKKNIVLYELDIFKKNFPDVWNPTENYVSSHFDLLIYIDYLMKRVNTLKVYIEEVYGFTNEYIQLNHLKKTLKLNT